jgi:hypothetical protein
VTVGIGVEFDYDPHGGLDALDGRGVSYLFD